MADTPHPTSPGPQPGDPNARKGVEGNVHGHADNPMGQLWMAMSGASAGEHHEEVPGVSPQAAKVGHEPDQFPARTIVYVPIVVAVTLVITYLIVQTIFSFVNGKESQQLVEAANAADNNVRVKDPNAVAENQRTWNPRDVEKGNTDGAAKPVPGVSGEQPRPPVPQPPLEARRVKDYTRMGVDGRPITDPPNIRSTPPKGDGNSPEIYPEDLRPGAAFGPPAKPRWTDDKKTHADLSLEAMIELLHTHDDEHGEKKEKREVSRLEVAVKAALKVADKPAEKPAGTLGKPRISTGGLTPPKGEKPAEHKH